MTGVDLTEEHCDAARELNAACGLSDRVRIMQGSALALPLPDAGFDRAYSHNVVMNIADKASGVSRGVPRVEAGRAAGAVARQCRAERVRSSSSRWAGRRCRRTASSRRMRKPGAISSPPGSRSSCSATCRRSPVRGRRSAAQTGDRGPAAARPALIRPDGLQVLLNSMRAREDGRACEVQIVARKPD